VTYTANTKIEYPNVLIVEGKDESNFFQSFLNHLHIENFSILPIGGKTQLGDNLVLLIKDPKFHIVENMGIIQDADSDPQSTLESIKGHLKNNKLPVPTDQMIRANGNPSITILILPGNNRQGMLEDLCLDTVSVDPAIPCVEDYINCLESNITEMPSNIAKAKLHSFLASRKKTGLRLGEAAQKGYWNWESSSLDHVKDFIQMVHS